MDLFSPRIKAAGNLVCTTLPPADPDTWTPGSKREIKSAKLNCFLIIWLVISALFWPLPGELGAARAMRGTASDGIPGEGVPGQLGHRGPQQPQAVYSQSLRTRSYFPSFISHLRMTGRWRTAKAQTHQYASRTKALCDWQTKPKEGEETLFFFLWGWLWTETPEILALKSFSRYQQITLQVNTFPVHWVTVTYLKKNLRWKVIMVEKYSLLYGHNSCTPCP